MHQIDYKQKYKSLKQKLKFLIYEQECFLEELRKSQKKLLRVSRDKSFLLDRLSLYVKVEETSDDSDATASSDSDADREGVTGKRKRIGSLLAGHLSGLKSSQTASRKRLKPVAKRPRTVKSPSVKHSTPKPRQSLPGQMTREELEIHLAAKEYYNSIEVPPNKLPTDIFSDNSIHASDEEADEELVIDLPS